MGDTKNRKEEILDEAVKLFSQKGYDSTTTKEIAKEVGIAEGTIFRYFKTKNEILDAIIIRMMDIEGSQYIIEPIIKNLKSENDDESQVLFLILKERTTFIDKNIKIFKTVFAELLINKQLRDTWSDKVISKVKDVAGKYIKNKIKEGKFRDIDIYSAMRSLIGTMLIYTLQKNFMQGFIELEDEDTEIRKMVDIFLNGIKK